ncbi:MAG: PASTA domain-containing protein [Candidatus Aminicenantes bacterium]|nr:PASTA domain-containing protein [Candidatus Aminicenantes bacterium]
MPIKKIYKPVFFALLILDLFLLSAVASFRLTLADEVVNLPNLIGKTFDEVKSDLAKKKLTVVQSGYQLHQNIEKGRIIYQDPSEGSKLKLNGVVKVILSSGKEKVTVPQLVNKMEQSVNSLLKDADLRKGKISHIYTPKHAAGRIVSQYPPAEVEVGRESRVSFLVSQGKNEEIFLMPDLLGRRVEPVLEWLESLEFRVGDTRRAVYGGLEAGIIINQTPQQGFPIKKRTLITLEVSK